MKNLFRSAVCAVVMLWIITSTLTAKDVTGNYIFVSVEYVGVFAGVSVKVTYDTGNVKETKINFEKGMSPDDKTNLFRSTLLKVLNEFEKEGYKVISADAGMYLLYKN